MKLRFTWKMYFFGRGRTSWNLYFRGRLVGGVIRYRWGSDCIAWIGAEEGDRGIARAPTPGPARSRLKAVARALLSYRTCSAASLRSAS